MSVKRSLKWCCLSDHWRKKGNNQFAVWHCGKGSWRDRAVTEGAGSGYGLGFLFSKQFNSRVCPGTVTVILQLLLRKKWSLISSSNLEVPKHWFSFLFSAAWRTRFNFFTLFRQLQQQAEPVWDVQLPLEEPVSQPQRQSPPAPQPRLAAPEAQARQGGAEERKQTRPQEEKIPLAFAEQAQGSFRRCQEAPARAGAPQGEARAVPLLREVSQGQAPRRRPLGARQAPALSPARAGCWLRLYITLHVDSSCENKLGFD